MSRPSSAFITKYAKLWPREVFYIPDKPLSKVRNSLDTPGVYILYQDFDVFYIGQAASLFKRLKQHADKRYRLWNHFSAFAVNENHLDEVESIMIAATPRTANRQGGRRIDRIHLPPEVRELLLRSRQILSRQG
jgi:hypothetical protein